MMPGQHYMSSHPPPPSHTNPIPAMSTRERNEREFADARCDHQMAPGSCKIRLVLDQA